jgi:hypothetical protein
VKPLLCVPTVAKAIREGLQTVDRRPLKEQPPEGFQLLVGHQHDEPHWRFSKGGKPAAPEAALPWVEAKAPWRKGDILWVRERARVVALRHELTASGMACFVTLRYEADGEERKDILYPARLAEPVLGACIANGVHFEGARTWLKVLEVRPVLIQETTAEEALAEGCPRSEEYPLIWFRRLWERLYPDFPMYPGGWVWRTHFERCEKPEGVRARAA